MSLDNLRDLFHEQLKDIYSAEKQLTEALPKMVKAARDKKLQDAFQHHLNITERQFERVRRLLDDMDVNPGNKKCKAMEGLIEEGTEMVKENGDATTRGRRAGSCQRALFPQPRAMMSATRARLL